MTGVAPPPRERRAVYRVSWLPGSDRLVGRCHCGAERPAEDPAAVWEWLLAHPDHPDPAEPQ